MARTTHNRRLGCRSEVERDQPAVAGGLAFAGVRRPVDTAAVNTGVWRYAPTNARGPFMGATYRRQAPGIRTRGVRRITGRL